MPHDCPSCDKTFDSTRGVRSHHAQVHGEKIRDYEECEWCGADTINTENSEKTFCDRDCYAKWQSEYEVGENHPSWKGGPVTLECEQCGSEFERKQSHAEESRFCSQQCQGDWLAENKTGLDHPLAKQSVIECSWCGEEFHRSPSNIADGENFCCKPCYSKWMSENRTGENHPRYTGGRENYGRGWNDKKKQAVRERDGYECQSCGMTQDAHKDEYGRSLTVHHIRKASAFDNPEKRNAMSNLVTVCMGCHGEWEKISPLKFMT
jgi:5-methylcytosine-specific restriction endonuclease McrA